MTSTGRIDSMDQIRGYTMTGMFLVNFLGAFAVVHPVLKHHNNYNSCAVTDPCPNTCILTVSSNEPINGTGDGDTSPDWQEALDRWGTPLPRTARPGRTRKTVAFCINPQYTRVVKRDIR